jgi:hypothetical protein
MQTGIVLRGNLRVAVNDRRQGVFITGDRFYEVDTAITPNLEYINQAAPAARAALVIARIPPQAVSRKPLNRSVKTTARIDHSRWVVDCPFNDPTQDYEPCNAAQMACLTDPRFLCHQCLNAEVGGAFIAVEFPPSSTIDAIEREVAKRPHRSLRHWLPGETVEDIIEENRAAGIN